MRKGYFLQKTKNIKKPDKQRFLKRHREETKHFKIEIQYESSTQEAKDGKTKEKKENGINNKSKSKKINFLVQNIHWVDKVNEVSQNRKGLKNYFVFLTREDQKKKHRKI